MAIMDGRPERALKMVSNDGEHRQGSTQTKRKRENVDDESRRGVERHDTIWASGVSSISAYAGPSEMIRDMESPYLRVELKRMLLAGVDFLDFATTFCPSISLADSTASTAPTTPTASASSKPTIGDVHDQLWNCREFVMLWKDYITVTSAKHTEADLYVPFAKLINCAFKELHIPLDYISCDDQPVGHEHDQEVGSKRKPDGAVVAFRGGERGVRKSKDVKWGEMIVPFEFKAHKRDSKVRDLPMKRSKPNPSQGSGVSDMLRPAIHALRLSNAKATKIQLSIRGNSAKPLVENSETIHSRTSLPVYSSVPDSIAGSSRRRFSGVAGGASGKNGSPSKGAGTGKGKPQKHLKDEEQLASYCLEILSTGLLRRHALGVFVDDAEIQLWCLDRSGAMGSRMGHFGNFAQYFTTLVFLLSFATPDALGYEPLLTGPKSDVVASSAYPPFPRKVGAPARKPNIDRRGVKLYRADLVGCRLNANQQDELSLGEWVRNVRGIVGEGTNVWKVSFDSMPKTSQSLFFCALGCEQHQPQSPVQVDVNGVPCSIPQCHVAPASASSSSKHDHLAPSSSLPRPSLLSSEPAGLDPVVPSPSFTMLPAQIPLLPSRTPSPRAPHAKHSPRPDDSYLRAQDPSPSVSPPVSASFSSLVGFLGCSSVDDPFDTFSGSFSQQLNQDGMIPAPTPHAFDFEAQITSRPATSTVSPRSAESDARASLPAQGGNPDFALKAVSDPAAKAKDFAADITSRLHTSNPLSSTPELTVTSAHMLQISWQAVTRVPEADFYRIAFKFRGVKSAANGQEWNAIPRVMAQRCVTTLGEGYRGSLNKKYTEYPRTRMPGTREECLTELKRRKKILREHYEDRALRFIVLYPLVVPLYTVRDPKFLLIALISLLDVHCQIYRNTGVLHRSISLTSLCVRADNQSQGMLLGFEAARQFNLNDDFDNQQPHASMWRLALIPFVAWQLCHPSDSAQRKEHVYRHDLESFFWVLIWICAHYVDGVRTPTSSLNWEGMSWGELFFEKSAFLSHKHGFEERFPLTAFAPNLAPLRPCVLALRAVFTEGYNDGVDVDDAGLDSRITYEKVREALTLSLKEM